MKLRPIEEADVAAVLKLNQLSVDATSPLDADRLRQLIDWSTHAHVLDGDRGLVAFFLVFAHDSEYDSANFAWFVDRYPEGFLYLDRIIVAEEQRRRGIGSLIYSAVETQATPGRLTCEVVCEPPNTASLAFHRSRGFVEVGRLPQPSGTVCSMLVKELPG